MTASARGPRARRLGRRDQRSARPDVGRRCVARGPAGCARAHRKGSTGHRRRAARPGVRTSPTARRRPSPPRPDGRPASPRGESRSERRETGPAPRPRRPILARSRGRRDGAVRPPPHGRPPRLWRAGPRSFAVCGLLFRSSYRTRCCSARYASSSPRRSDLRSSRSCRRSAPAQPATSPYVGAPHDRHQPDANLRSPGRR